MSSARCFVVGEYKEAEAETGTGAVVGAGAVVAVATDKDKEKEIYHWKRQLLLVIQKLDTILHLMSGRMGIMRER